MKIRNIYGFNAILSLTLIYGFYSLIFILMSILGIGYGLWLAPIVCFPVSALFIAFLTYLWIKVTNILKPFKQDSGKIIEAKLKSLDLRGWMISYNIQFVGDDGSKNINGIILASWTNTKLKIGQTIKCYEVNNKYLLLKN